MLERVTECEPERVTLTLSLEIMSRILVHQSLGQVLSLACRELSRLFGPHLIWAGLTQLDGALSITAQAASGAEGILGHLTVSRSGTRLYDRAY